MTSKHFLSRTECMLTSLIGNDGGVDTCVPTRWSFATCLDRDGLGEYKYELVVFAIRAHRSTPNLPSSRARV